MQFTYAGVATTLDVVINGQSSILEKVETVVSVWTEVSTCYNSQPVDQVIKICLLVREHTLSVVLSGEWNKVKSKYAPLIVEVIQLCDDRMLTVTNAVHIHLSQLIDVIKDPWGNVILSRIMNTEAIAVTDEVYRYVLEESPYTILTRLKKLYDSRCEDMALRLVKTVMICCDYAHSRDETINMSVNQKLFTFDVYITLLYKFNKNDDIIEHLIEASLQHGVQLVKRFTMKRQDVSRLWRNANQIAQLAAALFCARAIKDKFEHCEPHLRELTSTWLEHSVLTYQLEPMKAKWRKMVQAAATASHVYVFCDAITDVYLHEMRNFKVELYILGLSTDLNSMEDLKSNGADNSVVIQETSIRLAKGLVSLGQLFSNNLIVARECVITSFSIHPTSETLRIIESLAVQSNYNVLDTGQWRCKLHPPHDLTQDIVIKCDSCSDYVTPLDIEDVRTALTYGIDLCDALRSGTCDLTPQLVDDLIVVIFAMRYRLLSWTLKWEVLHRFCAMYLHDPTSTQNFITELKFIEFDYSRLMHKRELMYNDTETFTNDVIRELKFQDDNEPVVKKRRGRPRKLVETSDSEDDDQRKAVPGYSSATSTANTNPATIQKLRTFRRNLKRKRSPSNNDTPPAIQSTIGILDDSNVGRRFYNLIADANVTSPSQPQVFIETVPVEHDITALVTTSTLTPNCDNKINNHIQDNNTRRDDISPPNSTANSRNDDNGQVNATPVKVLDFEDLDLEDSEEFGDICSSVSSKPHTVEYEVNENNMLQEVMVAGNGSEEVDLFVTAEQNPLQEIEINEVKFISVNFSMVKEIVSNHNFEKIAVEQSHINVQSHDKNDENICKASQEYLKNDEIKLSTITYETVSERNRGENNSPSSDHINNLQFRESNDERIAADNYNDRNLTIENSGVPDENSLSSDSSDDETNRNEGNKVTSESEENNDHDIFLQNKSDKRDLSEKSQIITCSSGNVDLGDVSKINVHHNEIDESLLLGISGVNSSSDDSLDDSKIESIFNEHMAIMGKDNNLQINDDVMVCNREEKINDDVPFDRLVPNLSSGEDSTNTMHYENSNNEQCSHSGEVVNTEIGGAVGRYELISSTSEETTSENSNIEPQDLRMNVNRDDIIDEESSSSDLNSASNDERETVYQNGQSLVDNTGDDDNENPLAERAEPNLSSSEYSSEHENMSDRQCNNKEILVNGNCNVESRKDNIDDAIEQCDTSGLNLSSSEDTTDNAVSENANNMQIINRDDKNDSDTVGLNLSTSEDTNNTQSNDEVIIVEKADKILDGNKLYDTSILNISSSEGTTNVSEHFNNVQTNNCQGMIANKDRKIDDMKAICDSSETSSFSTEDTTTDSAVGDNTSDEVMVVISEDKIDDASSKTNLSSNEDNSSVDENTNKEQSNDDTANDIEEKFKDENIQSVRKIQLNCDITNDSDFGNIESNGNYEKPNATLVASIGSLTSDSDQIIKNSVINVKHNTENSLQKNTPDKYDVIINRKHVTLTKLVKTMDPIKWNNGLQPNDDLNPVVGQPTKNYRPPPKSNSKKTGESKVSIHTNSTITTECAEEVNMANQLKSTSADSQKPQETLTNTTPTRNMSSINFSNLPLQNPLYTQEVNASLFNSTSAYTQTSVSHKLCQFTPTLLKDIMVPGSNVSKVASLSSVKSLSDISRSILEPRLKLVRMPRPMKLPKVIVIHDTDSEDTDIETSVDACNNTINGNNLPSRVNESNNLLTHGETDKQNLSTLSENINVKASGGDEIVILDGSDTESSQCHTSSDSFVDKSMQPSQVNSFDKICQNNVQIVSSTSAPNYENESINNAKEITNCNDIDISEYNILPYSMNSEQLTDFTVQNEFIENIENNQNVSLENSVKATDDNAVSYNEDSDENERSQNYESNLKDSDDNAMSCPEDSDENNLTDSNVEATDDNATSCTKDSDENKCTENNVETTRDNSKSFSEDTNSSLTLLESVKECNSDQTNIEVIVRQEEITHCSSNLSNKAIEMDTQVEQSALLDDTVTVLVDKKTNSNTILPHNNKDTDTPTLNHRQTDSTISNTDGYNKNKKLCDNTANKNVTIIQMVQIYPQRVINVERMKIHSKNQLKTVKPSKNPTRSSVETQPNAKVTSPSNNSNEMYSASRHVVDVNLFEEFVRQNACRVVVNPNSPVRVMLSGGEQTQRQKRPVTHHSLRSVCHRNYASRTCSVRLQPLNLHRLTAEHPDLHINLNYPRAPVVTVCRRVTPLSRRHRSENVRRSSSRPQPRRQKPIVHHNYLTRNRVLSRAESNRSSPLQVLNAQIFHNNELMIPRVVLDRLDDWYPATCRADSSKGKPKMTSSSSCQDDDRPSAKKRRTAKEVLANVPGLHDTTLMRPANVNFQVSVVQLVGGRPTSAVSSPNTQTSTQVTPHIQRIGQPRSDKPEPTSTDQQLNTAVVATTPLITSVTNNKSSAVTAITNTTSTSPLTNNVIANSAGLLTVNPPTLKPVTVSTASSPTLINILSHQIIRPNAGAISGTTLRNLNATGIPVTSGSTVTFHPHLHTVQNNNVTARPRTGPLINILSQQIIKPAGSNNNIAISTPSPVVKLVSSVSCTTTTTLITSTPTVVSSDHTQVVNTTTARVIATSDHPQVINHYFTTANNRSSNTPLIKTVLATPTGDQTSTGGRVMQIICKSADGRLIPVTSLTNRVVKMATSQHQQLALTMSTSNSLASATTCTTGTFQETVTGSLVNSTAGTTAVLATSFANRLKKADSSTTDAADILPKFNQAFGKSVYQNNLDRTSSSTNINPAIITNNIDKTKTITKNATVNVQPLQGSVIYTRQMPVGQTINLIPQSRQVFRIASSNSDQISLVKDTVIHSKMSALLAAALQGQKAAAAAAATATSGSTSSDNTSDSTPKLQITGRQTLVQGARIVTQLPANVVRTSPQTNLSSTTLEQLREFDMVYKQVTERSSTSTPAETSAPDTSSDSSNVTAPRISVAYVNQGQKLNCAPVVVVSTYSNTSVQPAASPALSVASQGSSSPCVTPAPTTVMPKLVTSTSNTAIKTVAKTAGKTMKPTTTVHPTASKTSPIPKPQQKPQEDEHTTQRIFDILAEYAEQLRNSPDLNNKPAPRRRSNPPTNPNQNSKRKKSSSSSSGTKKSSGQSSSTEADIDDPRTIGSEDSSCGMQINPGDDDPVTVKSDIIEEASNVSTTTITLNTNVSTANVTTQLNPATTQRQLILTDASNNHQTRNLIITADSSVGEALKMPNTAVLVPGNYIMPVSMVKGGQQIAVMSGGNKILATVPGRSGPNMLLFQSFLNQARKTTGTGPTTVKYSTTLQPITAITSHNMSGQSSLVLPQSQNIGTVTLNQQQGKDSSEFLLTIAPQRSVESTVISGDSTTNTVNTCNVRVSKEQSDSSASLVIKADSSTTRSDDIVWNDADDEQEEDDEEEEDEDDEDDEDEDEDIHPIVTGRVFEQVKKVGKFSMISGSVATPVIAHKMKEIIVTMDNQLSASATSTGSVMTFNSLDRKVNAEDRVTSVLVTAGSSNGPMLSQNPPLYKQTESTVITVDQSKDQFLRNGAGKHTTLNTEPKTYHHSTAGIISGNVFKIKKVLTAGGQKLVNDSHHHHLVVHQPTAIGSATTVTTTTVNSSPTVVVSVANSVSSVTSQSMPVSVTTSFQRRQAAAYERELRIQKSLSEECEDLGVDEPSTSDLFPEAADLFVFDQNHSPSFSDQCSQESNTATTTGHSSVTNTIAMIQNHKRLDPKVEKLMLFNDDDFLFEPEQYQQIRGSSANNNNTGTPPLVVLNGGITASVSTDSTLLQTCTSMSDVTMNSPISPEYNACTPPAATLHKYIVHKYSNRKKQVEPVERATTISHHHHKQEPSSSSWTTEVSSSEDTTGSIEQAVSRRNSLSPVEVCLREDDEEEEEEEQDEEEEDEDDNEVNEELDITIESDTTSETSPTMTSVGDYVVLVTKECCETSSTSTIGRGARKSVKKACLCCTTNGTSGGGGASVTNVSSIATRNSTIVSTPQMDVLMNNTRKRPSVSTVQSTDTSTSTTIQQPPAKKAFMKKR